MLDFIAAFLRNSYTTFTSVTHPVFGISCAAVLLGVAGVKFGIWFIHTFIGASTAAGNSDASENHIIVKRR